MALGGTAMRILSAFIALPFVLYLMWIGGWPFAGLVVVATFIGSREFLSITNPGDRAAQLIFPLVSAAILLLAMMGVVASPMGITILAFVPLATICYFLFRTGDMNT